MTDPTDFGVAARCALIDLALADDHDDPLDDYVEAHVHGPLRMAEDVEAVVLDPSFVDTEVAQAAERLPCPVESHGGFVLTPSNSCGATRITAADGTSRWVRHWPSKRSWCRE